MQIQNLASITQKYPQFPTALSSDLPRSDESHAFILYGTTLNLAKFCVAVWVRLKARQKAFCNRYVKNYR